jgi:hypothetical protein
MSTTKDLYIWNTPELHAIVIAFGTNHAKRLLSVFLESHIPLDPTSVISLGASWAQPQIVEAPGLASGYVWQPDHGTQKANNPKVLIK